MLTEWIKERAEFFSGNSRATFAPSPSARLRASARLAALIITTGAITALWTLGDATFFRSERRRRIWRTYIVRRLAKAMATILGVRIAICGAAPKPPFYLVSNHLSYVDIVVYGAILDCIFVAKREVGEWPVIGPLSRRAGTLYVNRESRRDAVRASQIIADAVSRECGVALFPEGTSTRGDQVAPFKSALLQFAAASRLPVHYAAISYRTPSGAPSPDQSVCWWGDMGFLPHLISFLHLPRATAIVTFGSQPVISGDRKVLTEQLEAAVKQSFALISAHSLEDE